MLNFLRNKIVSVDRLTPDNLTVFGTLDDDLYGIQLEAEFSLNTLQIQKISGKWHRWTTPECPRALAYLNTVIGFKVGPGFRHHIQKTLGRSGCRHFANLLIEMGHAAKNAKLAIQYEIEKKKQPDLTIETFYANLPINKFSIPEINTQSENVSDLHSQSISIIEENLIEQPAVRKDSNNFCMDLHMHSSPASPCSTIREDQLIIEAKNSGIKGIVLTDHNYIWPQDQIQELRKRYNFPVFGGNEIITDQGDVLVYGFNENIKGIIPIEELRKKVVDQGGFMAAAHPFRAFLIIGGHLLHTKVKNASRKRIFEYVDAIEVFNGNCTDDENQLALNVAKYLGLKGIAGSDTHEQGSIGRFTTDFFEPVKTDSDFLEQLHAGSFTISSQF
jgi:predicted metal-dependent phosphoesterase TrpH